MMRLKSYRNHPKDHAGLSNVDDGQHHDTPENIEASNTSLQVYPLPAGPYDWDIPVPLNARVVAFALRSNWTCAEGSGKAGVNGIATRSSLEAATVSMGGHGTIGISAYNAIYSKKAAALNLSHKVFDASGNNTVCLTDAYLVLTSPTTRVLRLTWTNYGASIETLHCYAEIQVKG